MTWLTASFMHYLGSTVMRDFDKEKGRIAWNSASKYYASNVKTFIVDKFRTEERISVFRD